MITFRAAMEFGIGCTAMIQAITYRLTSHMLNQLIIGNKLVINNLLVMSN